MLVLSRKKDEIIRIGDDISIIVTGVGGGRVRLGIEAPKETPIYRSELYRAAHQTIIDSCVGSECYVPAQRSYSVSATIRAAYFDDDKPLVDVELLNGVRRLRLPLSQVQIVEQSAGDSAS